MSIRPFSSGETAVAAVRRDAARGERFATSRVVSSKARWQEIDRGQSMAGPSGHAGLEGFRERAGSKFLLPDRDAIASAIDPEVLLHLRHNLRIGEFVSGLDIDRAPRKRLGSAETLLEFQLCLTGPENQ